MSFGNGRSLANQWSVPQRRLTDRYLFQGLPRGADAEEPYNDRTRKQHPGGDREHTAESDAGERQSYDDRRGDATETANGGRYDHSLAARARGANCWAAQIRC
jgi:hypothetical protein